MLYTKLDRDGLTSLNLHDGAGTHVGDDDITLDNIYCSNHSELRISPGTTISHPIFSLQTSNHSFTYSFPSPFAYSAHNVYDGTICIGPATSAMEVSLQRAPFEDEVA